MKNMKNKSSLKTLAALTGLLVSFSLYAADSAAPVAAPEVAAAPAAAKPVGNGLVEMPAVISEGSLTAAVLAVANAGDRIVTVGDRGAITLSDDGVKFRQAKVVPTRATLTSVSFVSEKEGWAAGHWGVILHTTDGGETWTLQRDNLNEDRPLFTVFFKDSQNGFVAGLWSTLMVTHDGGKTWQALTVPAAKNSAKADRNLLRMFSTAKGTLLIAAEAGTVYRSTDKGATWIPIESGSRGSFWTGISLKSGTILMGGLAGNLFRSVDDGKKWTQVTLTTRSSITDMVQLPDGKINAAGLDGLSLVSSDDGKTFVAGQREDRLSITAVGATQKGALLLFSKEGLVSSK
jgi:photosystem II stability/assembly factor-like uncharacterized protein